MPKTSLERTIDSGLLVRGGGGSANGGGLGALPYHNTLPGLTDGDAHPQYLTVGRGNALYVPLARQIVSGAGLTGGGDLLADKTLAVGAGEGLVVNANDVALNPAIAGSGLAYAAGVLSVTPGEGLEIETDAIGLKATVAGAGLAYSAGVLSVGVANTGAAGLSVEADALRLTSSADPDATATILATTAAGLLTLRNGAFRQAAQSQATFASGFAGSGWRVDYGVTSADKASAEFDDLTLRGRMRIYEMLIQQIRASNGSLFVTSGSKVVTVTAGSNAWTVNGVALTFNGSPATFSAQFYTINTAAAGDTSRQLYHGFLYGDLPVAQQVRWNGSAFADAMLSKLEVTRVDSLTQYGAALVEGDAPAVGYDYVRRGNTVDGTRRGAIYLTSDDSNAPFIDIVDDIRSHADWNTAGKIKARLGKLSGISDVDFGGALDGYGLYSQNVYLKGKIIVTGGNAATTDYVNNGLSAKASTTYVDAIAALKANLTYVDSTLAAAVAPLAAIAYVDGRVTTIDGGYITTGTLNANRIGAINLAVLQAAVSNLSALSANLGTVTAGSIVVGSTNKLWLNDSADGALAIGGTVKSAAPFRVNAAGDTIINNLSATGIGAIGDFTLSDGNTYVDAPTSYNITTKGYKFRYGTNIAGGLTAYYSAGSTSNLYLDNNTNSSGTGPQYDISSFLNMRTFAGGAGKTATLTLNAIHSGSANFATLSLTNDGTSRVVAMAGTNITFNNNIMWHAGNDGVGTDCDAGKLCGTAGASYALLANPAFTGTPTADAFRITNNTDTGAGARYIDIGRWRNVSNSTGIGTPPANHARLFFWINASNKGRIGVVWPSGVVKDDAIIEV